MRELPSISLPGTAPRERRLRKRLLCAELVSVYWATGPRNHRREEAVLEDYSVTGASLYIPSKIEPGTRITIRAGEELMRAIVHRCEWRDDGYLISVEIDGPPAGDAAFIPAHLLDPEILGD